MPIVWWTCFVLYICMNNCCICFHVWMAPGKISFKLTGSPSLNKVFELNWIELNWKDYSVQPAYVRRHFTVDTLCHHNSFALEWNHYHIDTTVIPLRYHFPFNVRDLIHTDPNSYPYFITAIKHGNWCFIS